jgi:membrane protease YdiL (CAAX protease family)
VADTPNIAVRLSQKIDMSDLENANAPVPGSSPPLRTWDFMETVFVSLIAYGTYTLTSEIVFSIMLVMHHVPKTLSPAQLQALAMQGYWYGTPLIVASLFTIVVLWIAIRMAGREFAEYLALNWPRPRELVRALAIAAILLGAELAAVSFISARDPQETSAYPYSSVQQADGLFFPLIGGCIAGPILEEFVIRGFMFRGWSQSLLGPVGSIVLTSVLWGMMHTQYDWFWRFCIFVMGLALGYFRWRSNSTWLPVMVHSAANIFFFFAMGL